MTDVHVGLLGEQGMHGSDHGGLKGSQQVTLGSWEHLLIVFDK